MYLIPSKYITLVLLTIISAECEAFSLFTFPLDFGYMYRSTTYVQMRAICLVIFWDSAWIAKYNILVRIHVVLFYFIQQRPSMTYLRKLCVSIFKIQYQESMKDREIVRNQCYWSSGMPNFSNSIQFPIGSFGKWTGVQLRMCTYLMYFVSILHVTCYGYTLLLHIIYTLYVKVRTYSHAHALQRKKSYKSTVNVHSNPCL